MGQGTLASRPNILGHPESRLSLYVCQYNWEKFLWGIGKISYGARELDGRLRSPAGQQKMNFGLRCVLRTVKKELPDCFFGEERKEGVLLSLP